MRFLVDANLPQALCGWLTGKGHEATHVLEIALAQADDPDIWRAASSLNAVVVSKDEDFADLVRSGAQGSAVVWMRTGNGTNRQLFAYLEAVWPLVEERLSFGDRLVEIR